MMGRRLPSLWPCLLVCLCSVDCCQSASSRDAGAGAQSWNRIALRSTPAAVDRTFPVGPIVVRADADRAVVMWEPEKACDDGALVFGASADRLDRRVAASRDGRILKAHLGGLQTDTRYAYRVSACGLASGVLELRTAPGPASPIRFAVWGDSQSHPERSARIVERIKRLRPHMTLHVGDVVGDGTVYTQWRDELFTPLRPIGHYLPTHSAMGNHEKNARAYYRYFENPIPEKLRDPARWGANYALRYGNTFFLLLDTNMPGLHAAPRSPGSALVAWIDAQLRSEQARTATWRVAAAHHPALAECWTPGECDRFDGLGVVKDWLFPRLAAHGFHVYFCGHTHAYERGRIGGVLHIISGGAGGDLDEWCRDFAQVERYAIVHHFVLVDAAEDQMVLRAYRAGESEPFDRVVVERGSR